MKNLTHDGRALTFQKKFFKDIVEICIPIFKLFDITYFSHARAFHNGQFVNLTTNPELKEYYFKQKYPLHFNQGNDIFLDTGHRIDNFGGNSKTRQLLQNVRAKFNVEHFIYIIDKCYKHDDVYVFATVPENINFINQYINNRDIFKHFILYYKDKSASLIKKAELAKYNDAYCYASLENRFDFASIHNNIINRDECLKSMVLKKIHISSKVGDICVSARELECLIYVAKHFTFKEIAKKLSLSPRTVETYINNLKYKFKCEKKNQLIEILEENDLFNVLF